MYYEIQISIYVYISVWCKCVCAYVCVCVCVCAFMHACMHIYSMHVCMYACMYVCQDKVSPSAPTQIQERAVPTALTGHCPLLPRDTRAFTQASDPVAVRLL